MKSGFQLFSSFETFVLSVIDYISQPKAKKLLLI